jgi:hypothetical protein
MPSRLPNRKLQTVYGPRGRSQSPNVPRAVLEPSGALHFRRSIAFVCRRCNDGSGTGFVRAGSQFTFTFTAKADPIQNNNISVSRHRRVPRISSLPLSFILSSSPTRPSYLDTSIFLFFISAPYLSCYILNLAATTALDAYPRCGYTCLFFQYLFIAATSIYKQSFVVHC